MKFFARLRERWGLGLWGATAVLVAFALAGMTTVRLRSPIIGLLLRSDAPGWIQWAVYLVIMVPLYQLLLLGYGTLLGQFGFFWSRMKAVGRLVSSRVVGASG